MSVGSGYQAFFDSEGRPQIRESYCVFMDFLGFSDSIVQAARNGNEQFVLDQFIQDVQPLIAEATQPHKMESSGLIEQTWSSKVFTDNIVLGMTVNTREKENELGHAVITSSWFQLKCALAGYFVRGGMSYGNLFMSKDVVFGSALIEAHHAESVMAKFPRIALTPRVMELVNSHLAFYADPVDSPHHKFILTDHSGVPFLSYLAWLAEEEFIDRDGLDSHRKCVVGNLDKFASNSKLSEKYRWVAEYHNWFCDTYQDEDGDLRDFRIENKNPEFGIRSLRAVESNE